MTPVRVGIDIGGTFIDFVSADAATGRVTRTKVLNEKTRVVDAFREALARIDVVPTDIELLMHGTTLVTNLIIERDGARVGLITTSGFRDVLEIGWSFRNDAYDLQWSKPKPFVERPMRLEVSERTATDGEIITPVKMSEVRAAALELERMGAEAIVICFINSFANATNEREAREIVEATVPNIPCIASSESDARIGEFERVSTTVLSAYAIPRVAQYVDQILQWLPPSVAALFMQAEGGVAPASYVKRNPISLVASGPTAGVLATCYIGRLTAQPNLISFDVGGTSSDVCLIRDGQPGLKDIVEVQDGVPIRRQYVDVVSVGAGGGSVAWLDNGGALRVGPDSVGANPGPACYGRGGALPTVTDANVVLGVIDATGFMDGRLAGSQQAAEDALGRLGETMGLTAEQAALGVYRIANASMAQAIRRITVQKGIDPRSFTLVAFGGAGGQHAIEVAREMRIPRVIFPPHPSTFSALGLLTSDLQATSSRSVVRMLDALDADGVDGEFRQLEEVVQSMLSQGVEKNGMRRQRFADLRYLGQVHTIHVPLEGWNPKAITADFEDMHESLFGTRLGDPVEVVNLGLTGVIPLERPDLALLPVEQRQELRPARMCRLATEEVAVPVFERSALAEGTTVPAPALIEEGDSVIYLASGVSAVVDAFGDVVCEV
jgi:N-methylhydantoinase A